MKHFFHPRTLRYHLSPEHRKIANVAGIVLILFGGLFAVLSIHNSRTIAKNDLLTNEQLLTLRSAAKEDPKVQVEYAKLSSTMAADYVSARVNQTFFVTIAMASLVIGSLVLKVRKNFAKK